MTRILILVIRPGYVSWNIYQERCQSFWNQLRPLIRPCDPKVLCFRLHMSYEKKLDFNLKSETLPGWHTLQGSDFCHILSIQYPQRRSPITEDCNNSLLYKLFFLNVTLMLWPSTWIFLYWTSSFVEMPLDGLVSQSLEWMTTPGSGVVL
jgi:hypothetical protein